VTFRSRTYAEFWVHYKALPEEIRRRADKQFELFAKDPLHPSLHLKVVGELWSVRVTKSYRALALSEGNVLSWYWIGTHDKYDRILK